MIYFNYFTSKEFFPSCSDTEILKCCQEGFLDNILSLFQVLDALREKVGYPIIVTSTFRDVAHNKRVGGVATSQHLYASAVDFKCPKVPFSTFKYMFKEFIEESSLKVLLGQCIIYNKKQFIHLALRTPKHPKFYLIYE